MADKSWRERLADAIEGKQTSERALSIAIGRASSYVNGVLKLGKEPTIENLVKMADALDVSLMWLLFGDDVSPEAERLLRLYSGLSSAQKSDFLRLAESVASLAEKPD